MKVLGIILGVLLIIFLSMEAYKAILRRMEYYLYEELETGHEGCFKRIKIPRKHVPEWVYKLHDKLVIINIEEVDSNGNPTGKTARLNIIRNEIAEND